MSNPIRSALSRMKNMVAPDKVDHVKHSYAQCGEDLILSHLFHELRIVSPTYVDIGAHHPTYINNTYLFHLRGSRGINIEPDPVLFRRFVTERPADTNLNIGIGETRSVADLYVMNEPTLNTFVKEEADRTHSQHPGYFIKEVVKVPVHTINEVLAEHGPFQEPDLLSLDVEGLDEVVVRSMAARPKVMCIETITFSTRNAGTKKTGLMEHVQQLGYFIYADTFINTIFVRNDLWPGRGV
ncbi:MAG TPA: FkbM family methyltransferase [Flavobacteriales bacterium]